MKFIKVNNYEEMSDKAAEIIISELKGKKNCVLGLATGSSPIGTYKRLIESNKKGEIDFSEVTTVNLDEYVGLDVKNENSYRYFMNDQLFNHVNIDMSKTHVPNGCVDDLKKEGERYDAFIEEIGGIDLQVLGIGLDGHIGFNEPDTVFTKATHEVVLDESTIKANSRFFENEDQVPKKAITMGMMSIMKAKKIILVANGKEEILKKAFSGEIDPRVPASILQLHGDVTIIHSPV